MKDTESGYKYDNKRQKELEEALQKYFLEEEYSLSTTDLSPTRYRSWINCHTCFVNLYHMYHGKSFDDDVPKHTQTECLLQLGFYLGNWGMFRNSFIRRYDYELYRDIYTVLLDSKYTDLLDLKIETIKEKGIEDISKLLLNICKDIKTKFKPYADKVKKLEESENKKRKCLGATDTLITKILLVTFACVPAFDDNFSKAIGRKSLYRFNVKNIKNIMEIIISNELFFRKQQKIYPNYPLMKIIDAMYWKLGDMMKKDVAIN